eukprot:COSAG06_NODE_2323_length_7085_cov_7.644718_5_plen_75_part_00
MDVYLTYFLNRLSTTTRAFQKRRGAEYEALKVTLTERLLEPMYLLKATVASIHPTFGCRDKSTPLACAGTYCLS